MPPLSAQRLLELWELCEGQASTRRALAQIAGCIPETTWDALSLLPVNERDRHLLALRQQLFGPGNFDRRLFESSTAEEAIYEGLAAAMAI